jgi:formylglycine-generating enzyme required for sulfatase activity
MAFAMRVRCAALALAVAGLCGCDVSIPDGVLACTDERPCPEGFECRPRPGAVSGLCFREGGGGEPGGDAAADGGPPATGDADAGMDAGAGDAGRDGSAEPMDAGGDTLDGGDDAGADGSVDAGPVECALGQTRACGQSTGECREGTRACVSGRWGPCEDAVGPATETCDGKDNDCDETIDEGDCDCEDGDTLVCGTDVGECQTGTQECRGGTWGQCEGNRSAREEICDGADNDCDGLPDGSEGLTRRCGSTDVGACRFGTETCQDNGTWAGCDAVEPDDETCDGADTDCDGVLDGSEGFTRQCGSTDVGVCSYGTESCQDNGSWAGCDAVEPDDEVCNGADDDCNGTPDDGDNACGGVCSLGGSPGDACDGADADLCADGMLQCGTDGNSLVCDDDAATIAETCNGDDDDCDGFTDEGLSGCSPSCIGAGLECDDDGTPVSCCDSPLVTGGSFLRGRCGDASASCSDAYDGNNNELPEHSASVGDFHLDRFEVTVGRFQQYVNAYAGGWRPSAGDGEHPRIPGSGWQSDWNGNEYPGGLDCQNAWDPAFATYTSTDALLPMNCVTWYQAFAFCIWDGGRLPTEAEWEYAAAGGIQNLLYPCGDCTEGVPVYGCYWGGDPTNCTFSDIAVVGSDPGGRGPYGQLNLMGNMAEWVLDYYEAYDGSTCDDCAVITDGTFPYERTFRGGAWNQSSGLRAVARNTGTPDARDASLGFRCARD